MRVKKVRNPDACKALHRAILPDDEWEPRKNEQYWLVYDDANMPVGFASCHGLTNEPHVVFLSRSGLLECARGQGLQRKLITARVRWAKRNGFSHVITYTTWDNAASFHNLQKCGFRLYLPETYWAGQDMLYWIKDIG